MHESAPQAAGESVATDDTRAIADYVPQALSDWVRCYGGPSICAPDRSRVVAEAVQ